MFSAEADRRDNKKEMIYKRFGYDSDMIKTHSRGAMIVYLTRTHKPQSVTKPSRQ